MELTLVIITTLAAVSATFFILCFLTRLWEKSPAGRAIMSFAASVDLLAFCALFQRYDEVHPGVEWHEELTPLLIIAWSVVILVTSWQSWQILRRHDKTKETDRDEK